MYFGPYKNFTFQLENNLWTVETSLFFIVNFYSETCLKKFYRLYLEIHVTLFAPHPVDKSSHVTWQTSKHHDFLVYITLTLFLWISQVSGILQYLAKEKFWRDLEGCQCTKVNISEKKTHLKFNTRWIKDLPSHCGGWGGEGRADLFYFKSISKGIEGNIPVMVINLCKAFHK